MPSTIGIVASSYRNIPTWIPTDITGCKLWLDASDDDSFTYSSGTLVSQWSDKSTNAKHYSQATVSNQPSRGSNILNGLSVVQAADTDDNMTASLLGLGTGDITIFGVARVVGTSTAGRVYWSQGTNAGIALTLRTNVVGYIGLLFGNVAWYETSATQVSNTWYVETCHRSGSSTSVYLDGTALGTTASNPVAESGSSWLFGDGYPQGTVYEIAEIIVYNVALGTTDRETVEAYLATKWGITP